MKHMRKIAICAALAAFLGFALVGCATHYTPTQQSQTVSSSALKESGVLRVGVNSDAAPLAGKTASSGEIVGIDVDVAGALADELGVKVKIVDVGTDGEKALTNGTVDVVLGADSSATSDSTYWKSSSYLQTSVALFAPKGTTTIPTLDSKPKIAAQVSSKSSWRVATLYGDTSLVAQSDLKSAFNAMTAGTASYVAADAIVGSYVSRVNNYQASIIALLQDPTGYCAETLKTNTELQTALTTAINKLVSGGTIDIIESKWLGSSINFSNLTVVKAATSSTSSSSSSSSSSSASN